MNEDRFTSQNAWYHFVLNDIVDAMRLYGYQQVMQDIKDYDDSRIDEVTKFYD